jgi:hypothetical protein
MPDHQDRGQSFAAFLSNSAAGIRLLSVVDIFLGLGCFGALWQAVAVLHLKISLDPNEGWNAYHAAAAIAGQTLYPDTSSFMTNNYPPLSFYTTGLLGKTVGDNIVAGRILSLTSFLLVSGGIAILARKWSCRRSEALFTALFFAASLLLFSDYVGMNDPQLLGHALQISGLVLLVVPRRESHLNDIAVAALFVAGWFVKHNLVALPLASIIWLSTRDQVRAKRLVAITLAMIASGLLIFRLTFGVDLISRLTSPRIYDIYYLLTSVRTWLPWAGLPLATTFAFGIRFRHDDGPMFAAVYALAGTIVGVVLSGGAGVDANAMFDADIAIALGAGLAVAKLRTTGGGWRAASPWLTVALAIPFALGLTTNFEGDWPTGDFWLHPMQNEASHSKANIAWLKLHPGRVMCETLALCYWAGKTAEVDVFNLDQQFETGARAEGPFIELLAGRKFAALQIETLSPFPLPAKIHDALLANYRVEHFDDDGFFLVPRS